MMNPSLPPTSLKDTIYKGIVEMICNGQLTPGKIFTETSLIDHFSVSKSPVREALIQLCSEGVLRSIPRHGYEVVQISAKNIHDLTQLRLYLELSSLPEVMLNLNRDIIGELYKQNEMRRQPAEQKKIWDSWERNTQFHLSLIGCAGNTQVTDALERALATCTRAYAQLFTLKKAIVAPGGNNHHDWIVKALENHDIFSAHEYLKQDILFMEKELLSSSRG